MAGMLFWRENKVRNGNVDKLDNKMMMMMMNHVHSSVLSHNSGMPTMSLSLTFSPSLSQPSFLTLRQCHHTLRVVYIKPLRCTPINQQVDADAGVNIMCEPCNGRGWLVCDFCNGQKTNVKAENKRIYRRCPNCRAVGYVLCSKCKVFKCVTFPDFNDSENA